MSIPDVASLIPGKQITYANYVYVILSEKEHPRRWPLTPPLDWSLLNARWDSQYREGRGDDDAVAQFIIFHLDSLSDVQDRVWVNFTPH